MASRKRKTFRIRHDNGTYYKYSTGIGPAFGGTREDAAVYTDRADVALVLGTHFAFGDCELEVSDG